MSARGKQKKKNQVRAGWLLPRLLLSSMVRKPAFVASYLRFSSAMTGPPCNKEAPTTGSTRNVANCLGQAGCLVWRLLFAAAVAFEGIEGFVLLDDPFDIINSSSPNAVVRLVVDEQSRFAITVTLTQEELNGELKFEYLDPVRGKLIPPLVLKEYGPFKELQYALASSRMDFGDGNVRLLVTYKLANGSVAINATLLLTPFAVNGDTPCSTDWDCRRSKNRCSNAPNGRCRCPSGTKFDDQKQYCLIKCVGNDTSPCGPYLGESTCALGRCVCKHGAYLINNACSYPTICSTSDGSGCSGGAWCERYKCLCPTGTIRIKDTCTPMPCKKDSDCGLWINLECARVKPGSLDTACRCANNTAKLQASCNPITDLGPCPYGRCTTEYSECNTTASNCQCKKGYVQRIYGTNWVCEKQEIDSAERSCQDASACNTGEICEDNLCKCPKGQELQNVKCVAIKPPELKTNLGLFLWLSAAMIALIVVFLSFGCCLYLLAQRAENEQNAIAQMFDVTEDFSIKGSS